VGAFLVGPAILSFFAVPEWYLAVAINAGLPLILLSAGVMLPLSLWARHRVLSGFWAGALILWAALELPGNRATVAPPGTPLRVASANLMFNAASTHPLIDELLAADADVLILQEVSPIWQSALEERLGEAYPYGRLWAESSPFGIGLLSRLPMEVEAWVGGGGMRHAKGVLQLDGRSLTVFSLHPIAPNRPENATVWQQEFASFETIGPGLQIVGGDLNATPSNHAFRRLLSALQARDAFAECGQARARTFPAGLPLARIDHLMLGEGVHCSAIRVGEQSASDHRAVYADLVVVGE